jgi:hypothetical protein
MKPGDTIGSATVLAVKHGLPPAPARERKPRMTEKQFSKLVIDYAQLRGWRVAHFRPARVMRGGVEKYETPVAADGKGFPDLILCRGIRLLAAELKVRPNGPTPEQYAWLAAFRDATVGAVV